MPDNDIRTTRLESVEDIRQMAAAQRTPTVPETALSSEREAVLRFRPRNRPPMALICVLDDGRDDGDWIRVHCDSFVIGRSEGDYTAPYETGMSSRHFELRRGNEYGQFEWFVKDLESTNGTFARVEESLLHHDQEIILGSGRYRFDALVGNAAAPKKPAGEAVQRNATQEWTAVPKPGADQMYPALVELTADGDGQRYSLTEEEHWVGGNHGACSIVIEDDPFLDPRHARLFKDERGRWHIENGDSLNGTWVQIDEVRVEQGGVFQAGEQRFLIKLL